VWFGSLGQPLLDGEENSMTEIEVDRLAFFTLVNTDRQGLGARFLIDSIRAFGGPLRPCPIWLFTTDPKVESYTDWERLGVRVLPLTVPDTVKPNWFAGKVSACAQAEQLAGSEVQTLVWLSSDCLIIQPPLLFDLGTEFDAAVRPVHVKNIGLPASAPLDAFWKKVYETVGVPDVQTTIESFVDCQQLRAYFNSHVLAVNPARGLFRRWFDGFETLVADQDFQAGPCQDELHQIFLHQAVLSALIATILDAERVRMLPPDYSYPYNLHQQVPAERRAGALNDLVCIAYEDRPLHPDRVSDIEIHEPLRSWLAARAQRLYPWDTDDSSRG
jgi:hypothetical protein